MKKFHIPIVKPDSFPVLCITMILLLIISSGLYAQGQRGRITGRVIDDASGEPLTGATVVVERTSFGAAAGPEGSFTILNVPPGKYTVSASLIGYGKISFTDVYVNIDRSTTLLFRLKDKSIQTGTVEIVAQRPKIIKDQTSSANTLDNEQIKAAPLEGLRSAMDLSSSFQKNAQGDYQVRGSGANEVNFQINGVAQGNSNNSIPAWGGGATKANNSWKYDVNPIGVQQLQMITGGYNAEYGNAQGAVVKVVMKEGEPKFTGEARVEYRSGGQYHWGKYVYDKSNFEWQTWGDLNYWYKQKDAAMKAAAGDATILSQLGITGSEGKFNNLYDKVRNNTATASELAVWDSVVNRELIWAHDIWVKLHTPDEDNPLGAYDYRTHSYQRVMFGFGGPIGRDPDLLKFYLSGEYKKNPTRLPTAEKDQVYQNYILNFTSHLLEKHRFKLMLTYQKYVGGLFSGSDDIRWAGLSNVHRSYKYSVTRDPVRTEQTTGQSLNWTYNISNLAFLETNISHQYEKYELPYKYLLTWYDEKDYLKNSNDKIGTLLFRGMWWEEADYFMGYDNIATDFFQDNRSNQISVNTDYTNQFSQKNLFKAGFSFNYWDLINTAVTYNHKANAYISQQGVAEHYVAYPVSASFYLQDRLDYEGMIANLGLRVEGYNFQTRVPKDMYNYFFQGTDGPQADANLETVPSPTRVSFLPRVGISFPIGESTAFRLQYGHFTSMPFFSQALSNATFYGWTSRGNANLEPKKTINYEVGIQQVLDEENKLDLALYYNDRVSQIGTQEVAAYTGDARRNAGMSRNGTPLYYYDSFTNNLYGSTAGIELTLENLSGRRIGYRLSYSLSQTTDGHYGTRSLFPDGNNEDERTTYSQENLSPWDRTHTFRGLFQLNFREGEGFRLFGIYPVENSSFSFTYNVMSGTPFTYTTEWDEIKDVAYNRRYPLESSFDFNATKEVEFGGARLIFGLRIMNVFNNKWLTPMEQSIEQPDKENWLNYSIPIDQPDNPLKKSYLLYPFRAYRNIPRQIFFTFGVGI